MTRLTALFQSYRFLIPAAAVSLVGSIFAILPAAQFVALQSQSVERNFLVVGSCMLLIILSASLQTALLRTLIWGRPSQQLEEENEEGDALRVRSMGLTGTKLAFVFTAVAAANVLMLDVVGSGILILKTREYYTLTLLRSPKPEDRYRAVDKALYLTGDKTITRALVEVITEPGPAREWAAYALGARLDKDAGAALHGLLKSGTPVEQASAALALARLKDPELVPLVIDAYDGAGEYKSDLVSAVGMLSRTIAFDQQYADDAAAFFAKKQAEETDSTSRPLLIWTLGELRSAAGVAAVESWLAPGTAPEELCTALNALGKIGAADSSPKILELIYQVDRDIRCPELVHRDFAGHETLICEGVSLPIRILYDVASIGDRRAVSTLSRIASDQSFSERARSIARQIATQMRATPLTSTNGT